MSKYTILLILTVPIILAGMLNVLISYKLRRIGKKKFIFRESLWVLSLLAIIFLEPIYNFLINQGLTNSDPLSLFDVVMITAILLLFFVSTKAHSKIAYLEDRLNRLHRQLSINEASTTLKQK